MHLLPSRALERLHVLRTRAAVPAWALTTLALVGWLSDLVDGALWLRKILEDVPGLSWLTSSIGLLTLALVYVAWLLVRDTATDAKARRVEKVRVLLREAATALRAEAALSKQRKDLDVIVDAGYEYVQALDFLDDACVAQVTVTFEAFKEREARMYAAAGASYDPLVLAADYLDRLANSLSGADLDPGFRLPASFNDWCNGNQPNVRPINWT